MKKQILVLFAIISIFTAPAITQASAQAIKSAKADISFDFKIGEKTYRAGEYYFETISRSNERTLRIRSKNNRLDKLIPAALLNAGKLEEPKLVFELRGNDYYLSKIFLTTDKWGHSFTLPRNAENEQNLASGKEKIIVSLKK